MVEAQSRVGGRPGAADGQVDTRVLVRTDKWYGSEKAWPIWSLVTRAYAGAIDRDLSLDTTNAEISTDAVSNVQLGGVQLYVVLIMLCTRRALDCAVSAMYSWGMESCRMVMNVLSFCWTRKMWRSIWMLDARWNDARLVVLMLEVLAILLDTKDVEVNLDAGCIKMTNVDLNALDVGCDLFEIIQRRFREFWKKQGLRVRVLVLREATVSIRMSQETEEPRHGTVEGFEEKQRKEQGRVQVLSRVRQVWSGCEIQRSKRDRSKQEKLGRNEMVNVDLNALEIGAVLLLARNHKIQVGIDSCAAVTVFVHFRWFETKSCKSCKDLSARKVKGKLRGVSFWYAGLEMAETCEVLAALVAVSENDMSHDVFFPCYDKSTQACAYHEGCGTKLELESNGVFELPVLRSQVALSTVQLLESERLQRDFQDCHQR